MKSLLTLTITLLGFNLLAQDAKDEMQMIKQLFGTDKDLIVQQFVRVEGVNKQKFDVLYNDFEKVRAELGKQKFSALNSYVKSYNTLADNQLDEIMLEIIKLNAAQDKLIASYYKKIKKQCGTSVAAQFYQIEWYLLSEIRTAILENIPVLGDLEKK